ncbi:MAG: 30S ribosomal protein S9 [Candidatus Anstonellales archaeon]
MKNVSGKKKRLSKKKMIAIVTRGKRKESIARASIKNGKGLVSINGIPINAYSTPLARSIITEPLSAFPQLSQKVDIKVRVTGGGVIGQAQACRTAIARALLKHSGEDQTIKAQMQQIDRFLLLEDSRRVEPKKYKGPKARARFQKSYR